jgi:ADP-heptose:LPS heptosyltransferase
MPKAVTELRRERFDLVFDFQGLLKSAVLSRLTGARCVAGFCRPLLREKFAHHFYSRPVEIDKNQRHQIELNLDLVDPPRFKGTAKAAIPLDVPDQVEAFLDNQFGKLHIDTPVLLNPGAGWPTKRWPVERFVELASLIEHQLHIPVLFTYGPGEEGLIELARQITGKAVKSFPSSILELGALCRRSRLMVAGDTGPMHLAVALETPVVALIGPGHPWRTGPFSRDDIVVRHENRCPRPYQRTCKDHFCMDIPVEKVYEAVDARLKLSSEETRGT